MDNNKEEEKWGAAGSWLPQEIATVAGVYDILLGMRRCRMKLPNRCYHLISRVAHSAYFLDGDERTRLVDFVRRVAVWQSSLLTLSV